MSDSLTAICHIIFDRRRQEPYFDVIVPYTSSSAKAGRSENNAFTLYTIQSSYLRLIIIFFFHPRLFQVRKCVPYRQSLLSLYVSTGTTDWRYVCVHVCSLNLTPP